MDHRDFQANVKLRRGHYGNAILSRFPLADVESIDLSIPFKKRRQALAAHCRVTTEEHHRTLVLFNVHLGLTGFERVLQLKRLLASRLLAGVRSTTALVLGGDFNDVWGTLGRRVLEGEGLHSAGGSILTFPAFRPLRPLDRIYYRGRLTCNHCFGSHTQLARRASDHLPLVADFEME